MPAPLFRIGTTDFEFAPESAASFQDGGMSFDLRARPLRFDATAGHGRLFSAEGSDTAEPGWVAPAFWTGTYFFYDKQDTPQRRFVHPDHGSGRHDFYMWRKGMRYGIRFFGDMDLRPDGVELRGVLRAEHESDEQGLPLHLAWRCEPGVVALRPHLYRSMEEAQSVPPERVREMLIPEWDGQWPEALRTLTRLEFLSLQQLWTKPGQTASTVPEWLGELRSLRRLFLRSSLITALPQSLGALQALEELSVPYGRIESLPDGIARLPRLRSLALDGNRLRTLPASLGELPALAHLSVTRNPFESLPASLGRIAKIEIEKKKEALFRDIRYRPELEVSVDREARMARSSPWHVAYLREMLNRHGLQRFEPALLRHARQCLRLHTLGEDAPQPLGASRLGGAPDLPPSLPYPCLEDGSHLLFMGQIHLDAIADQQTWLPRSGLLYFFMQGQQAGDAVRVIHAPAAQTLQRYVWPEGMRFSDTDIDEPSPTRAVRIERTVSVPHLYGADELFVGEDAVLRELEKDGSLQRAYQALQQELTGADKPTRGMHLLNGHVFTQHDGPEEQASLVAGGLPEEWVNLLMLDSDNSVGFSFWDAGTFTFTIHEKDLALADFSRMQQSLESS